MHHVARAYIEKKNNFFILLNENEHNNKFKKNQEKF